MGAPIKRYVVREPITGAVVCKGTAKECAKNLGYKSERVFRNCVTKANVGMYRKYIIQSEGEEEVSWREEAIRKWDELTEPLRKEFGIPRYKGD